MYFNHPITKKELASSPGWSNAYLKKLLNERYFDVLHEECGYKKNDKILSPKILNKLVDLIGPFQDPWNTRKLKTLP